jgi:high-affinity Fe2+/Pb2+ permease
MSRPPDKDPGTTEVVRWGVGCLVAASATVGMLILVFLVAVVLQPPAWVQVVAALALAAGGVTLAWLVVSALAQTRADRAERSQSLRQVPPASPPPDQEQEE